MSSLPHLSPGDEISFEGGRFVLKNKLGNGNLLFASTKTGEELLIENPLNASMGYPDSRWFYNELGTGNLRIKVQHGKPVYERTVGPLSDVDCEDPSPATKKALLRQRILKALDRKEAILLSDNWLDEFRHGLVGAEGFEDITSVDQLVSAKTIRTDYRKRGVPGERPLNLMYSQSGRTRRQAQFEPMIVALMAKYALMYWQMRGWRMRDAFALFNRAAQRWADRQAGTLRYRTIGGTRTSRLRASFNEPRPRPSVPSRDTFERRVRELECWETIKAKWGEQEADRLMRPVGVRSRPARPLEEVELDHTEADTALVFDEASGAIFGRPTLAIMADRCTGCILAEHVTFGPPSLHSVARLIKRANEPKRDWVEANPTLPELETIFGTAETLYLDNALENVCASNRDALYEAGCDTVFCRVRTGRDKPLVERLIGRIMAEAQTLPGGIPGGPERLRSLGYDPSNTVAISLQKFEAILKKVVGVINSEPVRTTARVPIGLWTEKAKIHGLRHIQNAQILDTLLGFTEYRQLRNDGVQIYGINYRDPSIVGPLLESLVPRTGKAAKRKASRSVRVKVKVNPESLSSIQVWNFRTRTYVEIPAADSDYTNNLSLYEHKQIRLYSTENDLRFGTEDDRLDRRAELIDFVNSIAPKQLGKARKKVLRLRESQEQSLSGSAGVEIVQAGPSHDGLSGMLIPNHTTLADRQDGAVPPPNFVRGRAKADQTRARKQKAKAPNQPHPVRPMPETGDAARYPTAGALPTSYAEFRKTLPWANGGDT